MIREYKNLNEFITDKINKQIRVTELANEKATKI